MESFKIENIDIPTINFRVKPVDGDGNLLFETEIMGRIHTEVAELKSKAIRAALIEMGWVPPALHKCDGDHAEITPCVDPECWLK